MSFPDVASSAEPNPALSKLIAALRVTYGKTEELIGRGFRIFGDDEMESSSSQDAIDERSEWQHRAGLHLMHLQQMRIGFEATRVVEPHQQFLFCPQILSDLEEGLRRWCCNKSKEAKEILWQALFKLDEHIVVLKTVRDRHARRDLGELSSPRTPKEWRRLLEGVNQGCSESQWRNLRRKWKDDIVGGRKSVKITLRLSEEWTLKLPEFSATSTEPAPNQHIPQSQKHR